MKLTLWAICLIAQQLTQTLSMRSRTIGDYKYHVWAASLSNSVWFFSQFLIIDEVIKVAQTGAWAYGALIGLFYTFWCVLGSTLGMYLGRRWEGR